MSERFGARTTGGFRAGAVLLAAAIALFAAGSAHAVPEFEQFVDSPFADGFNIASPNPDYSMPPNYFFESASGDPSIPAAVNFAVSQCLYLSGSDVCNTSLSEGQGPYTAIMTWTVTSVTAGIPADGVLVFLSGLAQPNPNDPNDKTPDYDVDEVDIARGGTLLGFELTDTLEILLPIIGADPFVYLGFRIENIGDQFVIGYEVTTTQQADGTPQFYVNSASDFTVVPEPGTALLIGLGLGAMAVHRRRS